MYSLRRIDTISIIGLGYIGLPTAILFASRPKKVIGVDLTVSVVDSINRGELTIVEPELDILVKATVGSGYLRAVTHPEPAAAFLVAVPTPLTVDCKPDLTHIQSVAFSIAPVLAKGNFVILELTSPVGTTEKFAGWLR
jgi:nucleotide sugar dehydrogenase